MVHTARQKKPNPTPPDTARPLMANIAQHSHTTSSPGAILSISYDESLMRTREWILKAEGYHVTSALGLDEAFEHCHKGSYDLAIIGHSIPKQHKLALIHEIRKYCPAPVLSILRHGEHSLPEADHVVDSAEGPDALVRAVKEILPPPTPQA